MIRPLTCLQLNLLSGASGAAWVRLRQSVSGGERRANLLFDARERSWRAVRAGGSKRPPPCGLPATAGRGVDDKHETDVDDKLETAGLSPPGAASRRALATASGALMKHETTCR